MLRADWLDRLKTICNFKDLLNETVSVSVCLLQKESNSYPENMLQCVCSVLLHVKTIINRKLLSSEASFPLSRTVWFGTDRYALFFLHFHRQKGTKWPYLLWSPFCLSTRRSQRVPRGWSYTHCTPLTASRQKAIFKCCCRAINISLQYVFYVFYIFKRECDNVDFKYVVTLRK